ncbi:hypothetical protein [Weissella koreensis]|uniref:Uncharacterized protein n=1 Tax=Weissella koreensis TaxID=165096 RepID=A0A7H1MKZ6_9LACO|nr:hypothetical protein [Weissella koreensis]AVH74929.1 hypothetical protein C4597_02375 [Weissella koreensis]QGN20153.1 hypothetical protein GKC51_02350 [Weissella koreensis]QNT64132.1 hypothetical protein FY536_02075 [Weissella koreensis]
MKKIELIISGVVIVTTISYLIKKVSNKGKEQYHIDNIIVKNNDIKNKKIMDDIDTEWANVQVDNDFNNIQLRHKEADDFMKSTLDSIFNDNLKDVKMTNNNNMSNDLENLLK